LADRPRQASAAQYPKERELEQPLVSVGASQTVKALEHLAALAAVSAEALAEALAGALAEASVEALVEAWAEAWAAAWAAVWAAGSVAALAEESVPVSRELVQVSLA
jgi:hypothetical protein